MAHTTAHRMSHSDGDIVASDSCIIPLPLPHGISVPAMHQYLSRDKWELNKSNE